MTPPEILGSGTGKLELSLNDPGQARSCQAGGELSGQPRYYLLVFSAGSSSKFLNDSQPMATATSSAKKRRLFNLQRLDVFFSS